MQKQKELSTCLCDTVTFYKYDTHYRHSILIICLSVIWRPEFGWSCLLIFPIIRSYIHRLIRLITCHAWLIRDGRHATDSLNENKEHGTRGGMEEPGTREGRAIIERSNRQGREEQGMREGRARDERRKNKWWEREEQGVRDKSKGWEREEYVMREGRARDER